MAKIAEKAAAAEEQAAPATITIPLQDAEALYQMLRNVELAELHFHSCQAANFRQHVQATFHAQDVVEMSLAMLSAKCTLTASAPSLPFPG